MSSSRRFSKIVLIPAQVHNGSISSGRPLRPRGGARTAFVLVELIVVVGLLVALFVLYNTRTSINYQKKQQARCRQNLQTIHAALETYATDHNENFPVVRNARSAEAPLSLLIPKYTARTDIFICPGSGDKELPAAESFEDRKISYSYLMGLATSADPAQWLMADALARPGPSEVGELIFSGTGEGPGSNHDKYGGAVLFADGRVEITKPETAFSITRPPETFILNPAK